MAEENVSQEFRFKTIDETENYFLKEIERNELISKKHKKVSTTLNYIDHLGVFQFLLMLLYLVFLLELRVLQ